ncbi:restriction endonuclease subunit S [Myroides sp. NP-2]|uniref:restriction endonuclease subunit S n=1 Tax=Myroides sp. NP-2 TaxID=2759945 RepID=UPI0015F899B7|nr:restriction endonuclease subunit S [Myroides sp. NP-2]MBB1151323.1 restriction endonuclease subunit S [Myroides sp. NP-2]
MMENNWREVKLGDYIYTNKSSVSRGYPFDEINYLDTGSITCNKIDQLQQFKLSESPSRAKRLVENEDIIFSTVRPNQLHYGFIENPIDNLVVSTGFVTITVNKEFIFPKYLYYNIIQSNTIEYLHSIAEASTSTYPSLKPSDIEALEIQLPPLPEQKAIASVLSSLDDKIDLLHQQNQTLEALAETLYLNFIGEREFNSKLSDIFSLQNGYAFKSKSFKESGTIRVIKIKNISGDIVDITNSDFVDDESIKKLDVKFKINSGDILIAMTGAEVGKLGIVPETDQSLWLNQRVGSIKQKFEGVKYLVYLHLKSDFGQDYIENTATGSAQPNISGEGIENCEFPLYEEAELEEICNKLSPLYDKVIFNLGQIQTLTKLRDTLLPKLMSGEVRVQL